MQTIIIPITRNRSELEELYHTITKAATDLNLEKNWIDLVPGSDFNDLPAIADLLERSSDRLRKYVRSSKMGKPMTVDEQNIFALRAKCIQAAHNLFSTRSATCTQCMYIEQDYSGNDKHLMQANHYFNIAVNCFNLGVYDQGAYAFTIADISLGVYRYNKWVMRNVTERIPPVKYTTQTSIPTPRFQFKV